MYSSRTLNCNTYHPLVIKLLQILGSKLLDYLKFENNEFPQVILLEVSHFFIEKGPELETGFLWVALAVLEFAL